MARSNSHIKAEQRRFRRAQSGQQWKLPALPEFYYLSNFNSFLVDIQSKHFDLLGREELDFITQFNRLPKGSQATYVRMANRRGYVFNRDKFAYDEIKQQNAQWERLQSADFAETIGPALFRDWLMSLTKPELTLTLSDSVCETEFKKSWKKSELVKIALEKIDPKDAFISDRFIGQGQRKVLHYLLFLYFGRIEDNLQVLTHRDLGLVRPLQERTQTQAFDTIEEAKTAFFYASALHDLRNGKDAVVEALVEKLPQWPEPLCDRSSQDRDKLLQKLGGWAERNKPVENAITLYALSDAPICNERTIRLRWKRDAPDDRTWCKSRLEAMIENPSSDQEAQFAEDFYARKFQKKRTSATTDLLRSATELVLDEAFRNVPEHAALRHYKSRGLEAYRTENTPWRNLFGLLFWDLLHRDGASRRQTPSLLKSGQFYPAFREEIERRLRRLDQPALVMLDLLKTLSLHYGEDNSLVHWGSRSLDRIQSLITYAPHGGVATLLRAMAQDWKGTKDGFPDLMLIDDGRIRFVEVKTSGDSLRRNQLTRLRQLTQAGFATQIVKVVWAVDPNQPYVVVDVETTGGRPGLHRVTEIGAVKVVGGEIIDEFQTLIHPQRSIPPMITRLTGISNEMVARAPLFVEIAERFRDFMGDAIFAAHNVNFDYGFISAEYEMIDQRFRHPKLCTCASMRRHYPGHKSYSLKNLCETFNIDLNQHHRALCDAKAAAELLRLINEKRMAD